MRFLFYTLLLGFIHIQVLMAACTGNSVGSCTTNTDAKLPECVIMTVKVGGSLTSNDNVDADKRTSYQRYPLEFVHDGGSFEYHANAVTSGQDSGSSLLEHECAGKLVVFFNESGRKDVRVRVFQKDSGREAVSSNALAIIYDNNPPELEVSRIFVGTAASDDNQGLFYSHGSFYYTSNDIVIRATARDEELSTLQQRDKLRLQIVDGLSVPGSFVAPAGGSDGSFQFTAGLNQEVDGDYTLKLIALDGDNGLLEDGSPANASEPVLIKVIKDTTPPVMTNLEIIRHYGTANQVVQPAPKVFVGEGTLRVRATFSEPLLTPSSLRIEQLGLGPADPPPIYNATYDTTLFKLNPKVVEYIFAPRTSLNAVGPANFIFGEEGVDLAGNPVATNMGFLVNGEKVEEAIIIDAVPPDLNRVDLSVVGSIRTLPADGSVLDKYGFPSEILVVVNDYNLPQDDDAPFSSESTAMDYASGVDFSKIDTANQAESLKIELIGPGETAYEGTLITQPPNGLSYLLPSKETLFLGQPGKPETVGIPPGGVYTVRVTLADMVGNNIVRTFSFTIDVDDVPADSIQVSLLPEPPDNPYLINPIKGSRIPDTKEFTDLDTLDAVRQLQAFSLCSTDSGFNLTESRISLQARLHGPDTVPRSLITTGTPNLSDTENTCGAQGSVTYQINNNQAEVFPYLAFNFPNPTTIGSQVSSGTRDPRFGRYDGPYLVEIEALDMAGNISKPIKKEFLLDTTSPYTQNTFPENSSKINTPLRHVSAVLVDPHPPQAHTFDDEGRVNFGSGISIKHSAMRLYLKTPYGNPSSDFIDESNSNKVKGSLSFIHFPNATDPERPSYDPEDDAYKVLLEFRDKKGSTATLPTDGSADGIYHMEVMPFDNAGNSIDHAISGESGYNVQGLKDLERPQELRKDFYFLLDTVAPALSIGKFGASDIPELNIAGVKFVISGKTRDLSARPGSDALKGGSGIDRVEYDIVLMKGDGTLVPSEAGSSEKPAKNNPLFSARLAKLSPISDLSKDPHTSSTKPLDPATYADLELEERTWTIDDQLPPYQEILTTSAYDANYWLRISAYDQAGNRHQRLVRLILTYGMGNVFGRLDPPELSLPANNASLKHVVVNFEWLGVQAAIDYLLTISHPHGVTTTHEVIPEEPGKTTAVKAFQILNNEGAYTWWVEARDSVGNIGEKSAKYKFVMDRTAPYLAQMSWLDVSPEAMGKLSRGQFVLSLLFSEELQLAPLVKFRVSHNSVAEQLVVTRQFSDDYWEGLMTIPQNADTNWNGMATLMLSNAVDRAGNVMIADQSHSFEIRTGPGFQLRFFRNPISRNELVLIVKSTEELVGVPAVFSPQGVELMVSSLLQIDSNTFSLPVRLKASLQNQASLEITGRDLQGNPSTRVMTFAVQPFSNSTSTIKSENLVLTLPSGDFSPSDFLAVLPPPDIDDESLEGNLKKSLQVTLPAELRKTASLELLYSNTVLKNSLLGSWQTFLDIGEKQGLFLETNQGLVFLGRADTGQKINFSVMELGTLALYEDKTPPQIVLDDLDVSVSKERRKSFSFSVIEQGSGLDFDKLKVIAATKELVCDTVFEEAISCDVPTDLAVGDHELNVEIADRMGNTTVRYAVLSVPGAVQLQLDTFPNPARDFSMIQYDLNRSAEMIRLKIYDSAGRVVFRTDSQQNIDLGLNKGRHRWRWDLENSRGGMVAAGVYFCELSALDTEGSQDLKRAKLVVLK